MRATQAQARAAIAASDRVELQYIYSPGDRRGTRYVVTIDGWQDRVWHGAGEVLRRVALLNAAPKGSTVAAYAADGSVVIIAESRVTA